MTWNGSDDGIVVVVGVEMMGTARVQSDCSMTISAKSVSKSNQFRRIDVEFK